MIFVFAPVGLSFDSGLLYLVVFVIVIMSCTFYLILDVMYRRMEETDSNNIFVWL